ncbi:MAG TPA: CDF family Co(II)/Ni(II) efflux transporter DmeF [Alicycliphilus sp.]|nr:CDF family Co(II)/Ni(II) efflux transporter DmeF [Alicycliphilus sp.]
MHSHDTSAFAHSHSFADEGQAGRERALAAVTLLTLATMVIELLVGWWTGSLALTADGWHMGTHALALGGAVLAYRLSQRAAGRRGRSGGRAGYAFGGWKIEVLAAYTSGLALLGVALWLVWEGVDTLRHPRPVQYAEALAVAVIGLAVNLASVWLMARGGGHAQGHGHAGAHAHHAHHVHLHDAPAPHPAHAQGQHHDHHHHDHHHGHHDHNFRAAYLHVVADAFTSLLAIAALAGGAWLGLRWLDPAVALLGAVVIGQWSLGVLRGSAQALVDATEDPALSQRVREMIEADGDAKLTDLHVWQVGAKAWCAALSVVADTPLPAAAYRARLAGLEQLRHVTVEVHACPSHRAP